MDLELNLQDSHRPTGTRFQGQINTSLNGTTNASSQWLPAGTRITANTIKALAPKTHHIAIAANKNEIPSYDAKYSGETFHIYSNVYNNYASTTENGMKPTAAG